MTLILVALAAGLIAGISPCILPILPIVFVAGAAAPDVAATTKVSWRRSVAIVLGLVLSFSLLSARGLRDPVRFAPCRRTRCIGRA